MPPERKERVGVWKERDREKTHTLPIVKLHHAIRTPPDPVRLVKHWLPPPLSRLPSLKQAVPDVPPLQPSFGQNVLELVPRIFSSHEPQRGTDRVHEVFEDVDWRWGGLDRSAAGWTRLKRQVEWEGRLVVWQRSGIEEPRFEAAGAKGWG